MCRQFYICNANASICEEFEKLKLMNLFREQPTLTLLETLRQAQTASSSPQVRHPAAALLPGQQAVWMLELLCLQFHVHAAQRVSLCWQLSASAACLMPCSTLWECNTLHWQPDDCLRYFHPRMQADVEPVTGSDSSNDQVSTLQQQPA